MLYINQCLFKKKTNMLYKSVDYYNKSVII
nr:MAG TPA: hypothetical protein [Caudoviricetes sp.]